MANSTAADPTRWQDAMAAGMDREALRYQAFCADRLLALAGVAAGERMLDVAAGSGALAMSAAQAVGAEGRVVAIDLSERMLARLEAKIAQFGIANVDIHHMDGTALDFRRDYFHHALCSLGLDRFAEPHRVVSESRRVLRPGGRFGCSSLASAAFAPQLDRLRQRIGGHADRSPDPPWAETGTRHALSELLTSAGLVDVTVQESNLGYRLADVDQWWEVVQFSSLRRWLEPLTASEVQELRVQHLREIAGLVTAEGLWLDVPVVMAIGRKP